MADEDKEKAEKLAAAKKRFEQLKKEQKKGKKGGKKKEDKPAETKADENAEDTADAPETTDDGPAAEAENEEADDDAEQSESVRQPSLSQQSKRRSESFRQGADGPQSEVQDLYRKQASKIEQLEKENKALSEEKEQGASRLAKAEEELEGLREGSDDMASLKTKAKDAERLEAELASVRRQLSQAQQQQQQQQPASAAPPSNPRRISGPGTDLDAQLASKTTTIETLELEISNLRHQLTTSTATLSERDLHIIDLTSRLSTSEASHTSLRTELDALRASLSSPSPSSPSSSSQDPVALTSRITVLESDLRTATSDLSTAASRATQLESKIEALTRLHRDATSSSAAKDRELSELRAAARKQTTQGSHVRDASEFELGEGETEEGRLQARIRALEAENFELKRGVWRERRAELQPGIGDGQGYEDVDLGGGLSPRLGMGSGQRGMGPRQSSTLSDVITSGINAFTGRERGQSRSYVGAANGGHGRKPSLGLISDDGFDEDAFRLAQEEEGKRRIERVKEAKRSLEQWRGWRVDVAESRQQGIGYGREVGPVFEV